MILPIVQTGDPVLRQRARALTPQELGTKAVRSLIASMQETMRQAPGVGLAAPQVGESLQLVVIEDRAADVAPEVLAEQERRPVPFQVLVNPVLTSSSPHLVAFFEGCLSVNGFRCVVPRALEIEVRAINEAGKPVEIKARGWYARILQHEIDHLNGMLCIDRMVSRSLTTTENYVERWQGQPLSSVQRQLGW